MKKLTILLFSYLIFFSVNSFGHVQHYNKVKYLKYNLYLNNELIGHHIFNFSQDNEKLIVNGEGLFKVSKLGIDLINYQSVSKGIYKGNQLIKFNSKTTQNEKNKYVNVELKDGMLIIDGSSYRGETDKDSIISSLWNHEIVTKSKQISSVSGRVIEQKVKFLGKKIISINNNSYETLNFHIFSDNTKPMSEKKINIKIWYDINTLLWIKASYEKFGLWEYRISDIKN